VFDEASAAFAERERIERLTGMRTWVVTSHDGSANPHHVVLGVYRTEERAAAAATTLLENQFVSQATVVPLPPRGARQ
jgi:hypothetical protein